MRKLTHISIFIIVFLIASTAGMVVALFGNTWIDFAPLEHYKPGKPTIVLDDTGVEWARFELDKRKPIQLDAVPEHLIQAFVAAEIEGRQVLPSQQKDLLLLFVLPRS